MSKYWGYSKRPKNWKTLMKEDYREDEDKPMIPDRPEKPGTPDRSEKPPVGSPRIPRANVDSSSSHI